MVIPKEKRIYLGLLAATACLVGMVVFAIRSGWSFRDASSGVVHTTEVVQQIHEFERQLKNVESGSRGFALTGNPEFLKPYEEGLKGTPTALAALQALTTDNARQHQRLKELSPVLEARLEESRSIVAARQSGGMEAAALRVNSEQNRRLIESVRKYLQQLNAEEQALLAVRLEKARNDGRMSALALVGGLLFGAGTLAVVFRQIRAREAVAVDLRRHSEEIHDLYNHAPCGYHSVDPEGVFLAINDTELKWLGYTREQLIGRRKDADLMTPESRDRYRDIFTNFKQEGQMSDLEFELVRKDGSTLPVLLSSTAIYDAAGRYVSCRSMLYDHRERQRTEQLLEQSRDYAESIVETVREPLVILDESLRVTRVNRSFVHLFKAPLEDVVDRPLVDLGSGQWNIPGLIAALREVVSAGREIKEFEVAREFPGIGFRVMLLNARNLYRPGDETRNVLLAIEDITERRAAEAIHLQFRGLFESLPGLYLVMTSDLTLVAASDAFLKATMVSREEVMGRNLFEVFPNNPGDPNATGMQNVRASIERVRSRGQADTMPIQRYDIRRPDGTFEERHWSPVNSPVFGVSGRLEYIVHRVEDVTEFVLRKGGGVDGNSDLQARLEQMEAEVFRSTRQADSANERLATANSEMEAFSYTVSHDLRSPLRHISGFAQMLERHLAASADEKATHYLQTISQAAQQMGTLIDELLAFSRIGRAEIRTTGVLLGSIVEEVIKELKPQTDGRQIDWQVAPLPKIEGDPTLLRQVFAHLLGNAVKYTRGRETAVIEIGNAESTDTEETVFVRDNGAGFDPKYSGKLFGVFQRLHSASEFEGTGMGLASVRRIVQRHGGRVRGEGELDRGATFFVSLPKRAPGHSAPPSSP